jgi:sulfatase modifying factor 1
VTNAQFAEFVSSTGYETESERFGWSFVFEMAITPTAKAHITQAVQGAEWWLPVQVLSHILSHMGSTSQKHTL